MIASKYGLIHYDQKPYHTSIPWIKGAWKYIDRLKVIAYPRSKLSVLDRLLVGEQNFQG